MNPRKFVALTVISTLLLAVTIPYVLAGKKGDTSEGGFVQETADCWKRANSGGWGIFLNVVTLGGYAVASGVYCAAKGVLSAIGKFIWNTILKWIGWAFQKLISGLLWLFQQGLEWTPNWDSYDGILAVMLKLIVPLLFIQLIVVAAFLLFCSIDPGQRARAKNMLNKLLIAAILIAVSKQIYILFVQIANGISADKQILNLTSVE
jgi:hypothetical protein